MAETSDEKRKMSTAIDWSQMIGTIAGPMQPSDTRESWLARAARKAGITYRQAKALRYGETTDPKHSVASRVLSAANQARIEQARHYATELAEIFDGAPLGIRNVYPNFDRAALDEFIKAARVLGALDSAGDQTTT